MTIFHAKLERENAGQTQRAENQFASLNVERKPREFDVAVGHGHFEPRFPVAPAVAVDRHVVRLRRNFVCFDQSSPNVIHATHPKLEKLARVGLFDCRIVTRIYTVSEKKRQ